MISLDVSSSPLGEVSADVLLIFVSHNWKREISGFFEKEINRVAALDKFSGKEKEVLSCDVDAKFRRVILFGVGEDDEKSVFDLESTVAKALKTTGKRREVAMVVRKEWFKMHKVKQLAKIYAEAVLLASYSYDKYRKKQKDAGKTERVTFIVDKDQISDFQEGVRLAETNVRATYYARDLVNEPGNIVNPTYLANCALTIAKAQKNVSCRVYEKEEIEKMGMEAFLGVSAGSDTPPKFIKLTYNPTASPSKTVVLVGKGITFDTGGLSLKPSGSMETMKIDMAGAAAVFGVFSQIGQIKPNVKVVGLIASCENMPSGKAMRPGDIVRAYNGTTIEVLNTDAEGRLTLADALSYAVKNEKPAAIIDLATLTGAMVVALGEEITGLFGNNKKLNEELVESANRAGELVWPMPLPKIYKEEIKSSVADFKNITRGRYGGAITAALFLQEFVGKTPWVHLDIAGPAYAERNIPLAKQGGTGFGVRTLIEFLKSYHL